MVNDITRILDELNAKADKGYSDFLRSGEHHFANALFHGLSYDERKVYEGTACFLRKKTIIYFANPRRLHYLCNRKQRME